MASVCTYYSQVSLKAVRFRKVEVTDNSVSRIAVRQDREALRLNVEVAE